MFKRDVSHIVCNDFGGVQNIYNVNVLMNIYIYIYIYSHVYKQANTQQLYIYVYMYMYVCMNVYIRILKHSSIRILPNVASIINE